MTDGEKNLLERFVETGDAEVFSEIVRNYASLVYSASVRVLGDKDQAAEATQETFFQLLKNAGQVTGSLSCWLYKVATGKSVDIIRRDSRRRQKESQYADIKIQQVEKWEDLSPYVDEAVNELDEESRQKIIKHRLENKPMMTIAEELGVSQPTISRRVDSALSLLRDKLRAKGIIATGAIINLFLLQNASEAVPPVVLNELGKMGIVGSITSAATASGGTAAATVGTAALSFNAKLVIAAAVAAVGIGGVATYKYINQPPPEPVVVEQLPIYRSEPVITRRDFGTTQERETVPARPVQQDRPERRAEEANAIYGGMAMGYGGGMRGGVEQQAAVVDLNSPQLTMTSFAKILASGDFGKLSECFVNGSDNLTNLRQVLESDSPENAELKQIFLSIGEPIEVTNVSSTNDGYDVTWVLTVRKQFTAGGREYQPGAKFEMDTTVV